MKDRSVTQESLRLVIKRMVAREMKALARRFEKAMAGKDEDQKLRTATMVLDLLESETSQCFAEMRTRLKAKKKALI